MSEEDGMTATTHSDTSQLSKSKHGPSVRAALAAAFWVAAALIVGVANSQMVSSPVAAVVVEVAAILMMAAAYMRITCPEATLDHALFVGTAWVLLAIATELIMTARSGRQWFALLGSPGHGGLRCVLLIAWLIAPALFVRSQE
jgi:ABC-type Co2+ transport system permease subunit